MLHTLPDGEFLDALGKYGGIPDEAIQEKELMDLFLPVLRADLEVDERYAYTPESPLPHPISVFGGKDDPIVPKSRLEPWACETNQTFSLRLLDGGHFLVESARTAMLAAIDDDLLEVAAGEQ
jgi:medium-chain acyl-[acyl-carrier-protein] hydrolase